jgi:hypothetical protein
MIQPERCSDSHKAFTYFCDVTSRSHFLKENNLASPSWLTILFFIVLLTFIWLVHSFVPPPVLRLLAVPYDQGFWVASAILGTVLTIAVLFIYVWIDSGRIKKALKMRRDIDVTGSDWLGPEVQRSMLQKFTVYLMGNSLYNLEALKQLLDGARDEIEARWRAITAVVTVILALITLGVALILGFG